MATQTEVMTETTTQEQPLSNHPSQVPHNLGFSTYTPEGYWQRGSQLRRRFETPTRGTFQGDGRSLRPLSAPPISHDEGRKEEREGTPDAPRIPTAYLPTPYPTGPRMRPFQYPLINQGSHDPKNLRDEVHAIDPEHSFRGHTLIPESVLEEAGAHEMLTESHPDPQSPQERQTPIPTPIPIHSEPIFRLSIPNDGDYHRHYEVPIQHVLHSPGSSPIRILEPPPPGERAEMSTMLGRQPPSLQLRMYQDQYNSAMGSALDPHTNSSQPKRYLTSREALENIGEQCRRLGEHLGVRRMADTSLEDSIHSVRALAEAREADLPLWVAARCWNSVSNTMNRGVTNIRLCLWYDETEDRILTGYGLLRRVNHT
ncbi:hypothetical protein K435DRAFT_809889 [Dendrothele bispora CBS 962.96]|uniref:Uncharacterized protein n=1 Tax=Dendrothele bispora (strain CBS 962.96) TaxID=1314807 RepID=A0A4S8KWR6_DENBC|nr:hypothetical protein K435DRAFT_809889 [Dendrothele bispora CBS 962.96]